MDRRGRGESGDGPDYSIAKEYADVAAVVDAAAAATGCPVDLLGHSYGGNVAFGAATAHDQHPQARALRRLAGAGRRAPHLAARGHGALESLLAQAGRSRCWRPSTATIVQMSEEEISGLKAAPTWPARVAAAHTVPRELRAFGAQAFDPARAARIAVPVLLLVGADSPDEIKADPEIVAAALPDARIHVLEGQMHLAHLSDPQTFAGHVLAFLQER